MNAITNNVAKESFEDFLGQLKLTNRTLDKMTDFAKVKKQVAAIEMHLHELNYIVGKPDLREAVKYVFETQPKAFSVLGLLSAVSNENMYLKDGKGLVLKLKDFSQSPDAVMAFLEGTGLAELFTSRRISNLVDYVFGVEVGLDSNGRKNRFGKVMEKTLADYFSDAGIVFREQVKSREFPDLQKLFGKDTKKFDFYIKTPATKYLIETNFYSEGGSKPSEVARAYIEVNSLLSSVPGYTFVWITDGIGWTTAKTVFGQAYKEIRHLYNLTTISDFASLVKSQLQA